MSLRKLNMAPDESSYSVTDGAAHVQARLAGGASRIRTDYLNAPVKVELQWTCDENEFLYLQTFYRVQSTTPFEMDLIVHSPGLTTHECRFVPRTFKMVGVTGMRYVVRAQLEVIPNVPDDAYDEGLVTTFEAFGADGVSAYAEVSRLINVVMPENLK